MKIILSPCVMEASLELYVRGNMLIVNGEPLDFGPLEEGDTLPYDAIDDKFVLSATRKRGVIEVTVIYPIKENASELQTFPDPINTSAGKVKLP